MWVTLASVAALASGCGGNPSEACRSYASTVCSKLFQCFREADRTTFGIAWRWGVNESNCNGLLQATECAGIRDDTSCGDGKTFDSARAETCRQDVQEASCDSLRGLELPRSCDALCH